MEFRNPCLSNGTFLVVLSHVTWMNWPGLRSAPAGLISERAVGLCGRSSRGGVMLD